jgi:thioredoxin-like negative regulator of GroEL
MVAPELEKVATSEAGSSVVAKVNTDALPSLAQQFGISSIPTLILFQHGREFSRMAGARPAAAISAFIAQATATA